MTWGAVVMSFLIASHKLTLWVSFLPIVENLEHHVASVWCGWSSVPGTHRTRRDLGDLADHGVCSPRIALPWKDCLGIRQLHPEGAELFTSSIASGCCFVSYLITQSCLEIATGTSWNIEKIAKGEGLRDLSLQVYGLKRPRGANQGIKNQGRN